MEITPEVYREYCKKHKESFMPEDALKFSGITGGLIKEWSGDCDLRINTGYYVVPADEMQGYHVRLEKEERDRADQFADYWGRAY